MAKIDNNLIFLKSENSRIKIKDLSVMLKKSSQILKYSISQLQKESILMDSFTIFDYSFFGQIKFKVYFKGAYITEKDKEKIISQLSSHPYITSIYELTGEFDLVLEILAKNPSRFNKVLKKISDDFPTLNNYKTILNLVTHIYPRKHLVKRNFNNSALIRISPSTIIGGDRDKENFSENELRIMRELLLNPNIRFTSLSNKTELNVKTVKKIINSLRKRKVVKGFKHIINLNNINLFSSRLFLKLHNINKEREDQLMKYLLETQEIVQANKTIGDWNMEIDIEATDKKKIRFLILQLRENFKDIIETFNLIEFYRYYKRSYLPNYIFMDDEKEVI